MRLLAALLFHASALPEPGCLKTESRNCSSAPSRGLRSSCATGTELSVSAALADTSRMRRALGTERAAAALPPPSLSSSSSLRAAPRSAASSRPSSAAAAAGEPEMRLERRGGVSMSAAAPAAAALRLTPRAAAAPAAARARAATCDCISRSSPMPAAASACQRTCSMSAMTSSIVLPPCAAILGQGRGARRRSARSTLTAR